jgi:hypothetical protein
MELLIALAAAVTLNVPGRANATPSIAAAGDLVVVAWSASRSGGAADVYAAVSRDGGRAFGAPVRVDDVEGDVRVSGEQPPRVTLAARAGRDPRIVIVWTSKDPKGSRLRQSSSEDGGRTFARATTVAGTEARAIAAGSRLRDRTCSGSITGSLRTTPIRSKRVITTMRVTPPQV